MTAPAKTAPAKTAPKAKWAKFLDEHDIDVPKDATRADLIDLWNLNKDDVADDDERELTPTEQGYVDYRPAPTVNTDVDVPVEFEFVTDSGERREPEKLLIKIDGQPHYLYEPSFASLLLVGANLASEETPFENRIRTMMDLINNCLDTAGVRGLRAAMFARDNRFEQDILGQLTATIFQKWAPNEEIVTTTKQRANRAQRRRSTR